MRERPERISEEGLKLAAAKWILRNREKHRIPHSVMESIVCGAKSLYETALTEVRHQVIRRIKETPASSDVITSVCSVFDGDTQYTNIFKGLETSHCQNVFIKNNFRFVVCHITKEGTKSFKKYLFKVLKCIIRSFKLYLSKF